MLEFFKINSTKSLLRDFYDVSEASVLIGCDEKDILWYAANDKVELCYEVDVAEYSLLADVDNYYLSNLERLKLGLDGFYRVSDNSYLKIITGTHGVSGYTPVLLKGLWAMESDYKKQVNKYEGTPDLYPERLIPSGDSYLPSNFSLVVDYEKSDEYALIDRIIITKKAIGDFLSTVAMDKLDSSQPYQSQSEAQKNRHAIPQNEILMAVINLYHQDIKLRKENATEITTVLFEKASEFWPDTQSPPLSFETTVALLRRALKKTNFTKK